LIGCVPRATRASFHLGGNRHRIARRARKQRLREDDVLRRAAVAVGVVHIAVVENMETPRAIDAARLDQRVLLVSRP